MKLPGFGDSPELEVGGSPELIVGVEPGLSGVPAATICSSPVAPATGSGSSEVGGSPLPWSPRWVLSAAGRWPIARSASLELLIGSLKSVPGSDWLGAETAAALPDWLAGRSWSRTRSSLPPAGGEFAERLSAGSVLPADWLLVGCTLSSSAARLLDPQCLFGPLRAF